ncbi:hypothetical protein QJQ45_012253 [Haematococcus lacustris]|nr:hypothetical protein QJQ45_012253 [Haematococcus lacustris]
MLEPAARDATRSSGGSRSAITSFASLRGRKAWQQAANAETASSQTHIKARPEAPLPCNYCNFVPPDGGTINGLDRFDSELGYSDANTVACCPTCNMIKGPRPAVEFLQKVRGIAMFRALGVPMAGPRSSLPSATAWQEAPEDRLDDFLTADQKLVPVFACKVDLWASNCYLCGQSPAFGIDRVDASSPYTPENTRSCCTTCNLMKCSWTLPGFLDHIQFIQAHTQHWLLLDDKDLPTTHLRGRRVPVRVTVGGQSLIFPSANTLRTMAGKTRKAVRAVKAPFRAYREQRVVLEAARQGHTFVNQYLIIANLGKGAHGTVKLVYNTHDDMLYAMKVIKRKIIGGVQKQSSVVQPREQGQALRTQLSIASQHRRAMMMQRSSPGAAPEERGIPSSDPAALGMQPFPLDMEIEVMKELNHSNVVQLFEVISDQGSSLDDVWLLDSMHDALLRRQSGPEDGLGAGSAASNVIQQTSAHRLATSTSCQHLATAGSSSSKLADSKLVMVMEYVEGGCVMQGESGMRQPSMLQNAWPALRCVPAWFHAIMLGQGALPEDLARRYFRDILKGLEYLHYNTIVHGDLKPDNLLINLAGQVKISDFGSARLCHPGALLTGSYGTPVIMAPEQCTGKVYDAIQNQPLHFPMNSPRLSQDVISLITSLLEKDSSKRANLEMVMTHPWVTCRGTLPVLEFSGQRAVQKVLERISGPGRLGARTVHQQQPSPSGLAGVPMATNCALQHLLHSPHVQQKHYEDGQVILRQGDQCKGLFFVISGECEVVYSAKPKGGAVDADEDFQDVLEETRVDTSSSSSHSSDSSIGKATDSSSSPHAPVCDSPVIPASNAPQIHGTFAAAAPTNMQRISDISMSQHAGKLLSYNHANGSSSTQLSGLEVYPASLPEHQVSYLQSRFQLAVAASGPLQLTAVQPAVEEAAAQSTTSQTRLTNARLTASAPTHQKSQRHQHAVNDQAKPHAQRGTAQASDSHCPGSATRYKVLRSVVSSPATPPGHVPSEVHQQQQQQQQQQHQQQQQQQQPGIVVRLECWHPLLHGTTGRVQPAPVPCSLKT